MKNSVAAFVETIEPTGLEGAIIVELASLALQTQKPQGETVDAVAMEIAVPDGNACLLVATGGRPAVRGKRKGLGHAAVRKIESPVLAADPMDHRAP